jgi:hypothetical protein
MGGVYAAVCMSFEVMKEMGCVRNSGPFPGLARQDAGQGAGYAFFDYCHVFFWQLVVTVLACQPFLSQTLRVDFLMGNEGGTKRAALMIWENCDSNFDLLNIQGFENCPNMTSGMT